MKTLAAGMAVLLLAALLFAGGCGGGDGESQVADSGPAPQAERRSEDDRSHGGPVVLASTVLDDGRHVLLEANEDAGGACLALIGLDRFIRQCGRAPSERDPSRAHVPITAGPFAQLRPSAPYEAYGETSGQVALVVLRYATEGFVTKTPATLLRITDRKTLAAAGIKEPFGYYFKELPPHAERVRAAAFGNDGRRLGTDNYRNYRGLHPRVFISNAP